MQAIFSFDPHVHTVASGHHTTDRLIDVVKEASARGLTAVGFSEHAAGMLNGCTESGFRSMLLSPKERLGVRIFIGAEANILDESGKIDLSSALYNKLDYVISSLHTECFRPSGRNLRAASLWHFGAKNGDTPPEKSHDLLLTESTHAVINAMEIGNMDVLGHPADKNFPLNFKSVVLKAKETGVLIEINEASAKSGGYRGDNRAATAELLALCKQYEVKISVGSDSHGRAFVGDFAAAKALIDESDFPLRLIASRSAEEFFASIPRNRK